MLPRIGYLSEWWWGARNPAVSDHDRTVFTTPDPRRQRTGGVPGAPGTVRSSGSASAATGDAAPLRAARQRRDTRQGGGQLPGAALPRVLPVTPPGEVERLPGPARSPQKSERQDANPTAGSQPPRLHSLPERPWHHRGYSTRRGVSILPSLSVPADRHVSPKPGSPRLPVTRTHRENRKRLPPLRTSE